MRNMEILEGTDEHFIFKLRTWETFLPMVPAVLGYVLRGEHPLLASVVRGVRALASDTPGMPLGKTDSFEEKCKNLTTRP